MSSAEVPVVLHHLPKPASALARVVFWSLQPLLLISVMVAWVVNPTNPELFGLTFLIVHLLLGVLEYKIPARPAVAIVHSNLRLNAQVIGFSLQRHCPVRSGGLT